MILTKEWVDKLIEAIERGPEIRNSIIHEAVELLADEGVRSQLKLCIMAYDAVKQGWLVANEVDTRDIPVPCRN